MMRMRRLKDLNLDVFDYLEELGPWTCKCLITMGLFSSPKDRVDLVIDGGRLTPFTNHLRRGGDPPSSFQNHKTF